MVGCPTAGEIGLLAPKTDGPHFIGSCPPAFSSMEWISPTLLLFPECTIPTVEKDDIREWHPDCVDGAYDERLLWLSENLCLVDLGLPEGETRE